MLDTLPRLQKAPPILGSPSLGPTSNWWQFSVSGYTDQVVSNKRMIGLSKNSVLTGFYSIMTNIIGLFIIHALVKDPIRVSFTENTIGSCKHVLEFPPIRHGDFLVTMDPFQFMPPFDHKDAKIDWSRTENESCWKIVIHIVPSASIEDDLEPSCKPWKVTNAISSYVWKKFDGSDLILSNTVNAESYRKILETDRVLEFRPMKKIPFDDDANQRTKYEEEWQPDPDMMLRCSLAVEFIWNPAPNVINGAIDDCETAQSI